MIKGNLVLEDGTRFEGEIFGSSTPVSGEVVFNTGMVGYPESFTDPSYQGQILTLTYPLIGNYGVPPSERDELGLHTYFESGAIHIKGLVVSEYSKNYSHWNGVKTLNKWLQENNVTGIAGIDTRMLTKKLRQKGVMLGKILPEAEDIELYDPNTTNLVAEVSIKEPITYSRGNKRVVLVDCGCKNNIIRSLVQSGVEVLRVPWDHDFMQEDFSGLLISNGPGDPKMVKSTIENVKRAMELDLPIMGICLGNQIIALAAGADTYKLKFGHRSQNQPCLEVGTKRCYITSQNHGYAVNSETLPHGWTEWFVNANDETNEGIRHDWKPFRSIQFHPEATPGPVDTGWIFDRFVEMMGR